MKIKRIFLAFLFIQLVNSSLGFAQNPLYYLGGYLGYNYNVHTANFKELPPVPNCCKLFQYGTGSGISFGGLFDYPLKPEILLGVRVGYSSIGALLVVHDKNIGNTAVIDSGREQVVPVTVDHSIDSKIHIIALEPNVSFRFFDKFVSFIGLKASYIIVGTFSQKEQITSPDDVVFASNRSTAQNVYNNLDIPNKNSFLLFGILGLGYELPIGKDALLIPEIRYNMPFMSIAAVSWLPATWQFGASVKFPIYPPKEIKPVDTVKYEKKELPPLLTSSIEAVGISADGTRQKNPTLVIEETEVEEGFPLLPHVFFKEGSADLSITGLHLLNKEQIEGFQEDSLQWNTLKIYSELLNIVAYRMTKQPNEKITITGCNNNLRGEENNLAISGQRADAVKKYLVDVWGINKDRINIKTQNLPDNLANNDRPDGQQENQRAEISSTNFNLMKPIYLKEISKTSTPPVVEITPSIISDTGVHDYKIVVLQGKDTIRSYEGKNNPDKILWKTADKPVPLTETPINIKLTVIDSTGRLTMASTEISIQQLTLRKKRYELKDDKRIERFSLILFDYDKAEIKANNKLILEEVKSRIKDNSTVTIEGYADRTGELEYNKSLAQRRCDEIEKILKVKEQNLVTKPIGSSVLLYDNDMPQGRSYCRTVKINIETPVGK